MSDYKPQELISLFLEKVSDSLEDEFVTPQHLSIALQTLKYLNIKPASDDSETIDELRRRIDANKQRTRAGMVTASEQQELDNARGLLQ